MKTETSQLRFSNLGRRQAPSEIIRLMSVALEQPDLLSLAAGFTDNASLPLEDIKEIVADLKVDSGAALASLQYGPNRGMLELRELLLERLTMADGANAAKSLSLGRMAITNGSQQALYLALQTLCDAGDLVLVESPTYFVFLEILRGLGIRAVPMPMQTNGELDIDGVGALLDDLDRSGEIERLKAVYLVSYFANPTSHCVSRLSKMALGELLEERGLPIAAIEDAAYRELYYEEPFAAPSLLALDAFANRPTLYTSTLTKPYATGLKVGYAYCNDDTWLGMMLNVKGQQDFGTSHFAQAILEIALRQGRFDGHLHSLRSIYRSKMLALHERLLAPLTELGWSWQRPSGGLYLWLTAPDGVKTDFDSSFCKICLGEGVFYVPGRLCDGAGTDDATVRLSFGVLSEPLLGEAADRFVAAAIRCC